MSSSYYRICRSCGARIQMREMPNGNWVAFEGRSQHHCSGWRPTPNTPPDSPQTRQWPPWIRIWSSRLGYAIGLVFAGAYVVLLAAVLAGMLVGATVGTGLIGRDAALHVLAAAQATEPEVLLRNLGIGTALALLIPAVSLILWRRSQSNPSSKRHMALTWMAGFGLVWAVLFVGGEAFSRAPQASPSAQPTAGSRSAASTTAPAPTRPPVAGPATGPAQNRPPQAFAALPATPTNTIPPVTATSTGQPAANTPTTSPAHYAYVAGTNGQGAYLRRTPDWNDRLKAYPDGTRMTVFAHELGDDDTDWLHVTSPDGQEGYVPAQFTSAQPPATSVPTATKTPISEPPTSTRPATVATSTPTAAEVASVGSFTIGATNAEVEAIEGPPSGRAALYWTYGLATVDFAGNRVVGWSNIGNKLHVSLPGAGSKQGGYFSINSSRADVAAVQGVPSDYHATYWNYGLATIDFTDDHVTGWSNIGEILRVSFPGAGIRQGGTFSVGSTKADVAAVQGVPTGYHQSYWNYGLATVNFDGDRVKGWSNVGNVLHVS